MKPFLSLTCLMAVALVALSGCSSVPPVTGFWMAGVYVADNSESLFFSNDGRVFHAAVVNGKEERHFLGYVARSSTQANSLIISRPDTSLFIGTTFRMNEDFSTLMANWNNFRQPKDDWATTYQRKEDK